MTMQPALIVVVSPPAHAALRCGHESMNLGRIVKMVHQVSQAGLLTVCVVPPAWSAAISGLPSTCRVFSGPSASPQHGIAHAVQATPHHPGWLLLPAGEPVPSPATILAVADKISDSPVVVPAYDGHPGFPAGFAPEFYSELTQVRHESEISRMLSRYPVTHIPVNEPEWASRRGPSSALKDRVVRRGEASSPQPIRTALQLPDRTG